MQKIFEKAKAFALAFPLYLNYLIPSIIVTVHPKIINHMEGAFARTIINLSEYQQKMR
jgi:hypothetical protein